MMLWGCSCTSSYCTCGARQRFGFTSYFTNSPVYVRPHYERFAYDIKKAMKSGALRTWRFWVRIKRVLPGFTPYPVPVPPHIPQRRGPRQSERKHIIGHSPRRLS